MKSVAWESGKIIAVNQAALPHHCEQIEITTVDQLIGELRRLSIRGAPSIAAAGALGVLLAATRYQRDGELDTLEIESEARRIESARPTAVNLSWAVRRMITSLDGGLSALADEANAILGEIADSNETLARITADFLVEQVETSPTRVMTHCNTGWLATYSTGTALGAIMEMYSRGTLAHVYCSETRPLLQGARLTTWELDMAGIPHTLFVDSAATHLIGRGCIDCVVVGADRIARNGDTANKIGTMQLAVAARHFGVPFVVVAPYSTIDLEISTGDDIPIEQRSEEEVIITGDNGSAVLSTDVENPAFDVTPAELITAVITEEGIYGRG
ncbi:S-methyl-5-thioribose-1-phosphate isomerase [Actinopolyspora mzabensis]|uniref:S-methyl-5-thioribose-1-phosphate isomerase n=1 Tax=Actinopolyspora mzabensis TaxID=995066 RepID=A0A1G9EPU6_ACTMZ|nr:S-methyl-5-thioribose-1-phosphate isomerase [Actinopolyspora mzabensis]SDK78124.1 S-methyl-5-thioribose-1-phosphate isomerase [Actinopolyspora mzabensis]